MVSFTFSFMHHGFLLFCLFLVCFSQGLDCLQISYLFIVIISILGAGKWQEASEYFILLGLFWHSCLKFRVLIGKFHSGKK